MRSLTSVSREQEVLCHAILVVVHGDFRSTVAEFGIGIVSERKREYVEDVERATQSRI
jgi:hypothetical protein